MGFVCTDIVVHSIDLWLIGKGGVGSACTGVVIFHEISGGLEKGVLGLSALSICAFFYM